MPDLKHKMHFESHTDIVFMNLEHCLERWMLLDGVDINQDISLLSWSLHFNQMWQRGDKQLTNETAQAWSYISWWSVLIKKRCNRVVDAKEGYGGLTSLGSIYQLGSLKKCNIWPELKWWKSYSNVKITGRFLAETSARPETLKLFEEEKECQGVWNVVSKDKRAMRQRGESVDSGQVIEGFVALEVWTRFSV